MASVLGSCIGLFKLSGAVITCQGGFCSEIGFLARLGASLLAEGRPQMSGSKTGQALGSSQDSLYLQIAVHAFGIALAVVIGLVLLSVWNLLKEFREPMLWAL